MEVQIGVASFRSVLPITVLSICVVFPFHIVVESSAVGNDLAEEGLRRSCVGAFLATCEPSPVPVLAKDRARVASRAWVSSAFVAVVVSVVIHLLFSFSC